MNDNCYCLYDDCARHRTTQSFHLLIVILKDEVNSRIYIENSCFWIEPKQKDLYFLFIRNVMIFIEPSITL